MTSSTHRLRIPHGLVLAAALLVACAPRPTLAVPLFDAPFSAVYTQGIPRGPVLDDVSGDGRPDLIVPNSSISSVSVALGNGDGTFQASTDFACGTNPHAVAAGDVNEDGRIDLVTANHGSNTVSVLLGYGDGSFAAPSAFGVGSLPIAIALADFTSDGHLDIAVADFGANQILVLRGDGHGVFALVGVASGLAGVYALASGDLNADGRVDLVTANRGSNTISVLTSNGNGFFGRANYLTAGSPLSVAIGDLDGDSRPDVAVACAEPVLHQVSWFSNVGGGVLGGRNDVPLPGIPQAVAIGDVTGDGFADLIGATTQNTFSFVPGTGGGAFGPRVDVSVNGTVCQFIAAADLNQDARADVLVTDDADAMVMVFINHVGFGGITSLATGYDPRSVALGDLDRDGLLDVVATSRIPSALSVWLGTGHGSFGPRTDYPTPPDPAAVVLADLDGGDALDAVVTTVGGTVALLHGLGNGGFAAGDVLDSGNGAASIAAGDLDHDGVLDLAIVRSRIPGTVSMHLGHGDGTFTGTAELAAGKLPVSAVIGNLDLDAHPDIAVVNDSSHTVSLFHGAGNGTFGTKIDFPVGYGPTSIAAVDLSGEGRTDLAVACAGGSTVSVLLGDPDGSFGPRSDYAAPAVELPGALVIADANGDGAPDLMVASGLHCVGVFPGYGDGTFQPRADYGGGYRVAAIAIGDVNGDGWEDVVVVNQFDQTISVLLNVHGLVGVSARGPGASRVSLEQSFPNPAVGNPTIRFVLPASGVASLKVYDAAGRLVSTLADGESGAGRHGVRWDRRTHGGAAAAPGVYLYELRAFGERVAKRMVIVR